MATPASALGKGQTSAGTPKNAGIDFVNCHVAAQMDVYNDVCANYQYYAYRYTGMLIGSIRENVTIDGVADIDAVNVSVDNLTVNDTSDINATGNMTVGTATLVGDAIVTVGENLTATTINANNNLTADVEGDITAENVTIGGIADIDAVNVDVENITINSTSDINATGNMTVGTATLVPLFI